MHVPCGTIKVVCLSYELIAGAIFGGKTADSKCSLSSVQHNYFQNTRPLVCILKRLPSLSAVTRRSKWKTSCLGKRNFLLHKLKGLDKIFQQHDKNKCIWKINLSGKITKFFANRQSSKIILWWFTCLTQSRSAFLVLKTFIIN